MAVKKMEWAFPQKKFFFMRIEIFTIGVIAILVFFLTFYQTGSRILIPTLLTVVFLILYSVISYLIQAVRAVEERYKVTDTHFHVSRMTKKKTVKEKVSLNKIKVKKLDRFFLGGYLLSETGKHLIFFNTKDELDKFEKFVEKHSRPTKRKVSSKRKSSKRKKR